MTTTFPIFAVHEPGTPRLIFIDQDRPYKNTRICRTKDDPTTGDYDVLLEMESTAYSIAIHPDFANNGYIFVGHNGPDKDSPKGKSTWVTRYAIERKPPHKLLPASARRIIGWPSDGHNGGALTFGDDGMLYITSGDGTTDSDEDLKGQGLDHLLAKVLRIDVDREEQDRPYAVPKGNPFTAMKNTRPETWAYGLRNPWRIATDSKTGDIWVGNNGQDLWEQVYLLKRGDNYGWSAFEGSHPFYPNRKLGPTPVIKPAAEHHHHEARSLTGGVVYHGKALPKLRGMYIYGDYSTGKIWAIRHRQGRITTPLELAHTTLKISGFTIDADGELLVIDHSASGGFYHLRPREKTQVGNEFPRKLSQSGLFVDVAKHQMQPALIPYSVNSPLWSDGAFKSRYIALPGGDSTIEFHPTRSWRFPDGTVLVKSFGLEMVEGDPDSRKWIETRFLTRQQGEWAGYSYAWNDQQTDASLVESAGADREFVIQTEQGERRQVWRFPSRAECMVCHSRAANFVLGVSTPQLNRDHNYGDVTDNQLRTLEALGVFKHNPHGDVVKHYQRLLTEATTTDEAAAKAASAKVQQTRGQRQPVDSCSLLSMPPAEYQQLADPYDRKADLDARARSYLHVNCASCHVSAGGGNAQINLLFNRQRRGLKAIGVEPLHQKFGLETPRIIAAGRPEDSVLLHRMNLRGRGQMPPLATSLVDRQAVELIREWIEAVEPLPANDESE